MGLEQVTVRRVTGHASTGVVPPQGRRLRCVAVAWALLLALGFLLVAPMPAPMPAAMAAEPPPGMTRQQFDALVASVAEALSKGLAQSTPERDEAGASEDDSIDTVAERVSELLLRAPDDALEETQRCWRRCGGVLPPLKPILCRWRACWDWPFSKPRPSPLSGC